MAPDVVDTVNGPSGSVIEEDVECVGWFEGLDNAIIVLVVTGEPQLDEVANSGETELGHCKETVSQGRGEEEMGCG